MAKLVPVTSPQFRSQLIRKLRNVVPTCTTEFVDGLDRGVGFRLKDRRGRLRSNIVRIIRNGPNVLTTKHLVSAIWGAGRPPAGLPKEIESHL
jgi:hypothetical protein